MVLLVYALVRPILSPIMCHIVSVGRQGKYVFLRSRMIQIKTHLMSQGKDRLNMCFDYSSLSGAPLKSPHCVTLCPNEKKG